MNIVFAVPISTLLLFTAATAVAESNIDPLSNGQRYGWTENGGWLNLQGNTNDGVNVSPDYLQGFAWHENFGWINFGDGSPTGEQYSNTSAADFGVNIAPLGSLTGYAWGENIGWIAFDTTASGGAHVKIDLATGRFTGHAWAENIGWLSFDTVAPAHVARISGHSSTLHWQLY